MVDWGDLSKAYLNIFKLKPEDCSLVAVKLIGGSINDAKDKVYRFIGIVSCKAPLDIPDMLLESNEMVSLRNYSVKHLDDMGGPDLITNVVWKIKKKNGKKKKKHFDYTTHLTVNSVLDFEIVDGIYYIKTETYGLFYS